MSGSNQAAFDALDRMLDKLRAVPGLAKAAAPAAAKAIAKVVAENVAAGQDPYGEPWLPGKDGGKVLSGAAKAVTVSAQGSVIVLRLSGVEAKHHFGSAKGYHGGSGKLGGFRRPIIPFKTLPRPFRDAIRKALQEEFSK